MIINLRCPVIRKIFFMTLGLILFINLSHAQVKRPYEPIVLKGDTLAQFSNYEIKYLYVYAYDANLNSWKLIPFQIDEIDSSANEEEKYYEPESDSLLSGVLDFDDELVFMARDLGDKADSANWVDNTDSIRYEIELVDSSDGKKGYVYLYYSDSIKEQIPDKYGMYFDSINDRVSSNNYELGFDRGTPDTTGQMNDVRIKSGTGEDIFDRLKVRAIGWWLFYYIDFYETTIKARDAYASFIGPVRIIRNMKGRFTYERLDMNEKFTQSLLFYPYSGSFKIVDIPIGVLKEYGGEVWTIRVSWDLNENASGMNFYSEYNKNGYLIDGKKDNIDQTCNPGELNWTMATGSQGTMLNIFDIAPFGNVKRLYYYDNSEGGTGDNPNYFIVDTGDSLSFGDSGFSLENKIENYINKKTLFNVIYYNYFLHPYFAPDSASLMCEQLKNPLKYFTKIQKYSSPAAINENESLSLFEFSLFQNYPNPFNASTTISFTLPHRTFLSLQIYDAMGRLINKLVQQNLSAGSYKFTWSGQNEAGLPVSSGLYFCKLKAGDYTATKKLILIK